jgi:NADH dehydrogenase
MINVVTNARVKRVEQGRVYYTIKNEKGEVEEKSIPSGVVLWSTGVGNINPMYN